MLFGDISGVLRNWQEEARRAREADAPARALRLAPEIVTKWTKVLRETATLVEPGHRPCDYTPWKRAIPEAMGRIAPLDLIEEQDAHRWGATDLRNFIEDVALPAWPEPRHDLIEFALTVLETDVMLFRSGYAKRHLLQRLKQSPLTDVDIARIESMLHRAVIEGTGLEEYRAWCKLAGHLVAEGHLADLPRWLAPQAEGAILTVGMADGRLWNQILNAGLPDGDLERFAVGGWRRAYVNGVAWPDFGTIVPAGKRVNTAEQRVKRNAWRMLDHILRRVPDALDAPPAKG